MSNNDKCMHNPTFYIIKRKICKFIVCLIVDLLMQVPCHVLCTHRNVVMYKIILIG